MRYYDFILALIQENVSDERRDLFNMKSLVAFNIHCAADPWSNILYKFGISESRNSKKLLTYKCNAVNKRLPIEISHFNSPHATEL